MTSLRDIRKDFLGYFDSKGHDVVRSAPLVPDNDPTLLFVNAGMVPFKNYFTGAETPPSARATTSQKCVRAGGKHNDLDNVGYTARHHTFFEMLGNFSFGDYFKEDAIKYGWDLVTKDFGLPKDKLIVTVYSEDTEAAELWTKIAGLPSDRIIPISTSDNFWSMGDTGPCGPCSEIFFDHGDAIAGGPPGSPDEDGDRFIEIWNLVFMQYEKQVDGSQIALPKPSIDTGMGLERIAAIMQGEHDNYDIDLFKALIGNSVDMTSVAASGDAMFSHRVIADHLRSCSFLMADGVTPSNEGRGYVLRRIMRRAMRHAHILGAKDPLMHRLVPELINQMGEAFPELTRAKASIEATFEQEEVRFRKTLSRGASLLDEATADLSEGDALPGAVAFKLYDTYGFPLDLTQDAVRAKGLSVDTAGFDAAMTAQKDMAKAAGFKSGDAGSDAIWLEIREASGPTQFTGYACNTGEGALVAIVQDGAIVTQAQGGTVNVVFDHTPFYAESGGQAGDIGTVRFTGGAVLTVTDVSKKAGDVHVLIGTLTGVIETGETAQHSVDPVNRKSTRSNHSAAHLLHEALRNVLGEHVAQKGQMVDGERIRFDISHGGVVTREEIAAVEAQVNAVIRQNAPARTDLMSPEQAMEAGATALVGEKYGDEVRVLSLGEPVEGASKPFSIELCGGTHVERTGDIALFKVVSESAVAAGIRRIEAVTGEAARQYLEEHAGYARSVADYLKIKPEAITQRVTTLTAEKRQLEKDLSEAKKQIALGGAGGGASGPETINGVSFMGRVLDGVSGKDLRAMLNEQGSAIGSGIVAFVAKDDGKVAVGVVVTDDLQGQYSAVDLVNAGAEKVGGRGGGKPGMAQAGGNNVAGADEALAAIKAAI